MLFHDWLLLRTLVTYVLCYYRLPGPLSGSALDDHVPDHVMSSTNQSPDKLPDQPPRTDYYRYDYIEFGSSLSGFFLMGWIQFLCEMNIRNHWITFTECREKGRGGVVLLGQPACHEPSVKTLSSSVLSDRKRSRDPQCLSSYVFSRLVLSFTLYATIQHYLVPLLFFPPPIVYCHSHSL